VLHTKYKSGNKQKQRATCQKCVKRNWQKEIDRAIAIEQHQAKQAENTKQDYVYVKKPYTVTIYMYI